MTPQVRFDGELGEQPQRGCGTKPRVGLQKTQPHFAVRKCCQSVIEYRNAMGIACQVVQYMIRSAKRRFCIDNPLALMKHSQKGMDSFLIRKEMQIPGQGQFVLAVGSFETSTWFLPCLAGHFR